MLNFSFAQDLAGAERAIRRVWGGPLAMARATLGQSNCLLLRLDSGPRGVGGPAAAFRLGTRGAFSAELRKIQRELGDAPRPLYGSVLSEGSGGEVGSSSTTSTSAWSTTTAASSGIWTGSTGRAWSASPRS